MATKAEVMQLKKQLREERKLGNELATTLDWMRKKYEDEKQGRIFLGARLQEKRIEENETLTRPLKARVERLEMLLASTVAQAESFLRQRDEAIEVISKLQTQLELKPNGACIEDRDEGGRALGECRSYSPCLHHRCTSRICNCP